MSFYYSALCEHRGNCLNNVSFVQANLKARLFFKAELCNEKYFLHEGHFTSGTLSVAFF